MTTKEMQRMLEKEIPVLTAEILDLYGRLDKELGLHGADVPITFGYEEDTLGHYMPESSDHDEQFHFSLVFIGYCMKDQISKEDRENLYKHEYAHYMTRYLTIPKEFLWQPGPHGSAWKYCCALIKARPSKYFSPEENLSEDYESHLKKPPVDHATVRLLDTVHREKAYQAAKNSKVQFAVGDVIEHPKFGQGTIEKIEKLSDSVRLSIGFSDGIKEIDQKWLLKTKYKKISSRMQS